MNRRFGVDGNECGAAVVLVRLDKLELSKRALALFNFC